MIFFIVSRDARHDFRSVTEPSPTRPAGLVAEQLQFVGWMEVYPTLDQLFAAIVATALDDAVCREILATLGQELGLAVLDAEFLASQNNLRRTAALFYEVLYYWADPRVGNPQSPTPPSVDVGARINAYADLLKLDAETAKAMRDYVAKEKGAPKLSDTRRAQVRVFHNITDAARAVLGEVSTQPVYRLDKLFALALSRSDKLLRQQRRILALYRDRQARALADRLIDKAKPLRWNDSQYVKYYFGPALIKEVDSASPGDVLEALLASALDQPVTAPSATVQRCLAIWDRLPPVVRCAILFNDLRKFLEAPSEQTYVRASVMLAPPFDETGRDALRKVWPAVHRVGDPGRDDGSSGGGPVYPAPIGVKFLRAWNPDEHAPYAITARIHLCPLWAGPSGHTVNALRHWVHALGDQAPANTAAVVAASLFLFWRLYYDKRISAAHTLTEAFEATFVAVVDRPQEIYEGFNVAPFPEPPQILPDYHDAYDILEAARVKRGGGQGAVHPVGLVRTLARVLLAGSGFAGYDALKRRIDEERTALARRHAVPRWAHDATTASGVATRSFAPSDDADLRPVPVAVAERALALFGPVLAGIPRRPSGPRVEPWRPHAAVIAELADRGAQRERALAGRREDVAGALQGLRKQLSELAEDRTAELERSPALDAANTLGEHIDRSIAVLEERGPAPGLVTVTVLAPEMVEFLEHAIAALVIALRAATSPPERSDALARYAAAIENQGLRLRALLPKAVLAPHKLVRARTLSPALQRLRAQVIGVIAKMGPVFVPLIQGFRGGLSVVDEVTRATARQVWRDAQEDAQFLERPAEPFRVRGTLETATTEAVEVRLRQIARDLPGDLANIRDGLRSAIPKIQAREPKTHLNSFANRVDALAKLASEFPEGIARSPEDSPDISIKRWVPPPRSSPGPVAPPPLFAPQTGALARPVTQARGTSAPPPPPLSAERRLPARPVADQHWYSGDEIRLLLRLRLHDIRDDVYVMEGIDAHLHRGFTLDDNLREARDAVVGTTATTILLPVHVGGNHWTALAIRFDLAHATPYLTPTVFYADPQGTRDLPQTLTASLRGIFPGATIARSYQTYQTQGDSYNCGPWTVALLEYQARHAPGELPDRASIDIAAWRRDDASRLRSALQ